MRPAWVCGRRGRGRRLAVGELHFTNRNVLSKAASARVIVPEAVPGSFPVFYLLRGLPDDSMAWTRRTRIDSHVEGRPPIAVMPDGERGFYAGSRSTPRAAFETDLGRDVIGLVDTAFPTIPERSGCVVGNPSVGGYGALRLALGHPDLTLAVVSHSGAVEFASPSWVGEERRHWAVEYAPVFGEAPGAVPTTWSPSPSASTGRRCQRCGSTAWWRPS